MSLLHQVGLTFINNIGHTLAKSLVSYFGSVEVVFNSPRGKWIKVPGIGEKTIERMDISAVLGKAEEDLKFIKKNKVDAIFYTDSRCPTRLKNCNDAPVLLYFKSNGNLNSHYIISIVGTRNVTEYGKQI